ncbi:MAG: transglycosylase domain-containing protein [Bacteriovoracaceae bacterium]|nr:transglycosylase domain-containing protein [Bacteriovoracaceae bacterium]
MLKFLYILFTSVALFLLSLVFIYFTTDIEILKTHYPHTVGMDGKKVNYEFKPRPPAHWVRLDQISSPMRRAVVITEDWAFYDHEGVDFNQVRVIVQEFLVSRRFTRGGSTITQQLVKNILLYPDKTIWRKMKEIVLAKKMEMTLTKYRILELYLNVIEVGPGLYGVQKGAQHYFGKNASELDAREAAFIAMLLPNPKKYSESFRKKQLTAFARQRVRDILRKMKAVHVITEEQYLFMRSDHFNWEIVDPAEDTQISETDNAELEDELSAEDEEELQDLWD